MMGETQKATSAYADAEETAHRLGDASVLAQVRLATRDRAAGRAPLRPTTAAPPAREAAAGGHGSGGAGSLDDEATPPGQAAVAAA